MMDDSMRMPAMRLSSPRGCARSDTARALERRPRAAANPIRRLASVALCAFTPLLAGCVTVWSRGVVEDAQGSSVQDVSVRILDTGSAESVATTLADSYGCFMVGPVRAAGKRRLELEISAPGYKRATLAFDLETPVLLATLVPSASKTESEIRPATHSERMAKWEPLCIPVLPPGAQQLGP